MKPWNKSNWPPALKARHILKFEDDFWKWWQEQDALEEKSAAEQRLTQATHATVQALMVWSDDGGQAV
jgi:hypothetical protein